MSEVIRFGVSLNKRLLDKFDLLITKESYSNRSEALRDLIREKLVKKEWLGNNSVAGSITLVYDHHKRELLNLLAEIQHEYQNLIASTQHIHLDHSNCLEIIVVKGQPKKIEQLAYKMRSIKGVKHCELSMSTLGKELA